MNPAIKAIREATAAKGWIMADLAFVLGCSPARLSAWTHPLHIITAEQAKLFEAALGINAYHLLIDLQIPWQLSLPGTERVKRVKKIGDCPTCKRPIFERCKQQ